MGLTNPSAVFFFSIVGIKHIKELWVDRSLKMFILLHFWEQIPELMLKDQFLIDTLFLTKEENF